MKCTMQIIAAPIRVAWWFMSIYYIDACSCDLEVLPVVLPAHVRKMSIVGFVYMISMTLRRECRRERKRRNRGWRRRERSGNAAGGLLFLSSRMWWGWCWWWGVATLFDGCEWHRIGQTTKGAMTQRRECWMKTRKIDVPRMSVILDDLLTINSLSDRTVVLVIFLFLWLLAAENWKINLFTYSYFNYIEEPT